MIKRFLSIASLLKLSAAASGSSSLRSLQSKCMNEVVIEDNLTFKYRLDEDENGKSYITAELKYDDVAWLAAGIAGDPVGMVGTHAILANGVVDPALYELTMKDSSGIIPFSDDLQTLFDHSIVQDDVSTTLSFSKYLDEPGHNPLVAGETNMMLYAYGSSDDFGYHKARGMFQFELTKSCPESDADEAEEGVMVEEEEDIEDEEIGGCARKITLEDGLTFEFSLEGDEANGFHLIASMRYEGVGWVSVGIPTDPIGMVGTHAVIASGDMDPLIFALNAKDTSQVEQLSDEFQTLFDHSVEQDDVSTTLTFSKLLEEPGHNPLHADKRNTILYATGTSNDLGYHKSRGFFEINLISDCSSATDLTEEAIITFEAPNKNLWRAHGFLAAFAWGIATPIAVMSSVFRKYFPGDGLWFKTHMLFNMISILFTIAAVGIAFASFNKSGQPHLSLAHHKIGLVIFILALAQLMNGIFRPHVSPDHVTQKRKMWQGLHKFLGAAIIFMSIYNIKTGLDYYTLRYSGWNWSPVYLAWIGIVLVLSISYKTLGLFCLGKQPV